MSQPKKESHRGQHGPAIVRVATRLFGSRGYVETTMDDIAAGANITKRTLYRYVSSKQEILMLIHEHFLDTADKSIRTTGDDAFEERFREFVRSYVGVVVKFQRAVRVFFEEQHNLQPEARASVVARRDAFERPLRQMLVDAQQSGECRPGSVPVMSASILGALATTYRWYSNRGDLTIDEVATRIGDTLLHGIASDSPRQATGSVTVPDDVRKVVDAIEPPGTPESILTSATRLFAMRGFKETTTQELADASGLRKSLLFYYIESKDELLAVILTQAAAGHLREMVELLDSSVGVDAVTRLAQLTRMHASIVGRNRDEVRVLLDQTRHLSRSHRAAVQELQDSYFDTFQAVIAQAAGPQATAEQSRLNALVSVGMLNWMCRWFDPHGSVGADDVGQVMADIVVHGLVAEGPRP